jgi:hypothetical protein
VPQRATPLIWGSEAKQYILLENIMIAKHTLVAIHEMGLMGAISILWTANVNGRSIHPPIGTALPDPPQVVTSFELHASNDPATGKGAFVFEGHGGIGFASTKFQLR